MGEPLGSGQHPEVTSVLITGGDPMIMGEAVLRRYIEPLIDPRTGLDHLESIRIGTKSLAYWPQRFVTDPDADATLRLFEEVVASGRSLALMAHFSHPRELEPAVLAEAVRRIRGAGVVIRTQAPLIRSINDDAEAWRSMWRTQVRMGMVPYYMFVERDTGPQDYFAVPLARGHEIFREAYQGVSGWLTDLEPVFSDRFLFEPARYEVVPDELPGLFPGEPGKLMAPAI